MLSLDFSTIKQISNDHGLTSKEIKDQSDKLSQYLENIDDRDQGFYDIADNTELAEELQNFAQAAKGQFDDVVVLGIGGSALGSICIKQSLTHLYGENGNQPDLHVVDNIDPTMIRELDDVINIENTLFITVTKSGSTPETLSLYYYFRNRLEENDLHVREHMVFVTDPTEGMLRDVANEEGITAFDIPPNVGGRFSVLTPVGLLPAAMIGVDISKLLEGARDIRDKVLSSDFEENLSFQLATAQYKLNQKGKSINVMMPYAQKLIRLADWYRQLLAESIGKAETESGEEVHVGITPVNALGATDQHSQAQLYNEGPNDKLLMFIEVENLGEEMNIPVLHQEKETTEFLEGASFNELIKTEKEATQQALVERDRPTMTITIDKIDEYHLGQMFMLFEGATAFLGEFFDINAFNQPGVELAKDLTKEKL
ncbi:MAG: glucose-6-phosphate isomerase [Candidatus Magasanikbacteria bacterium]